MEWARILAYITGTVDHELLLRNEYLAAENRILRGQLKGRLKLSDAEPLAHLRNREASAKCPLPQVRGSLSAAANQGRSADRATQRRTWPLTLDKSHYHDP